MDLRRANSPEPLNMTWAGERSEQPRSFQSPEMFFLLTLPFIERACRERSIGGEKPTYRYAISMKLDNSKIDDFESASPVILDTPAQTKLF